MIEVFFALMSFLTLPNMESLIPKNPDEPIAILNMADIPDKLPRNFRSSKDSFRLIANEKKPSRQGLDGLNISGSAQFSKSGFKALFDKLGQPAQFFDIDLRQESHGLIDGNAISWYGPRDWANKGKSAQEIIQDQKNRLDAILKEKAVLIYQLVSKDLQDRAAKLDPLALIVNSTSTEEEFITNGQKNYRRFYIPDHVRPGDEDVDRFVRFIVSLPKGSWLHFHCAAGDGRTTTFMCMRDMMANSNEVSFDDIIERQYQLGGIDLSSIPSPSHWKAPYAKERFEFLRQFYLYTQKASKNNFELSWIQYLSKE